MIETNRLYHADNLEILRSLPSESIDLIYCDPPFNTGRDFGDFTDNYSAADNQASDLMQNATFRLVWEAIRQINGQATAAYIVEMAECLAQCRRILKSTGSLYWHCDWQTSGSIQLVLDFVFKAANRRNEIVWWRNRGSKYSTRQYGHNTDTIFMYSKSNNYIFHRQYKPLTKQEARQKFTRVDENGRKFATGNLVISRTMKTGNPFYEFNGYVPKYGWMVKESTLKRMAREGRVYWSSGGRPYRKYFEDEYPGKLLSNIWLDIPPITTAKGEQTGYRTQKPQALLRRVIEASSNEGGIVLDPFCGSGTTLVAAQRLGRAWIGIDSNQRAIDVASKRLGIATA